MLEGEQFPSTRALEMGYIMPPTCFREYRKNGGGAQRPQIRDTYAQFKNTPCVQILTSQVKWSGH